jgi:predicted AlkP superfamily pyrophosphatase or phosphodiesterase
MIHLWMVDEMQHEHGPWSAQGIAAIEEADRQLARLIEAAQRAGTWDRTLLIVLSDHGFTATAHAFYPGVLLRQAGLVQLDAEGKVTGWKAAPLTSAGQAYIYLADPADRTPAVGGRALFVPRAAPPGSGIAQVLEADAIRARGGDPDAFLSLLGAEATVFGAGYAGDAVIRPAPSAGSHGFDDADPAMRASLILAGPGVAAGPLEGARLIDVGPTAAAWLGVPLPDADGRALPVR